eukprot:NODE_4222_length_826_cov_6.611326_g3493_i0.p1 GENE.NODE_4222_length_826_cov_6.611326_g3493_i0~~NODE_4222_length_826_cov_6.611326_g3493_i0.p1  ORF type:complete len:199 (+),score=43.73 NODE_4222_length_826_cov_6.611326_g3493_i0:188-784(+)
MSSALLCLGLSALLLAPASSLTLKLEPKTEECFVQKVSAETPLTFQFQVTQGGLLDVDAHIFDTDGNILRQWNLASEGKHHWLNEHAGTVKFCFGNLMARFTPKYVSFFFVHGHKPTAANIEHLDPIEKSLMEVSEELRSLQEEQMYLRSFEHVHRDTVENTHSRILYWSLFEGVVLICMSLFQVYYLKRFLEVQRSI